MFLLLFVSFVYARDLVVYILYTLFGVVLVSPLNEFPFAYQKTKNKIT